MFIGGLPACLCDIGSLGTGVTGVSCHVGLAIEPGSY